MSEIRIDPVTGRRVILAIERAQRPQELLTPGGLVAGPAKCPFCPGNEADTPPEVFALRPAGLPANGADWRVRVVPNKYPALVAERTGGPKDAIGRHEVVIESPEHVAGIAQLSVEQLADVIRVYRQRLQALQQVDGLAHALIFKNAGHAAGATLEHIHSQILATPFVPPLVAEELAGSERFYRQHGRCVYCDMVDRELADGRRIVVDSTRVVAFCPFAGRLPFETWIVPKRHESAVEEIGEDEASETAAALRNSIDRIERAAGKPAYNLVWHGAPFDSRPWEHYHWHVEIIPRMTRLAGFELGSGCYINTVAPEAAAAALRA